MNNAIWDIGDGLNINIWTEPWVPKDGGVVRLYGLRPRMQVLAERVDETPRRKRVKGLNAPSNRPARAGLIGSKMARRTRSVDEFEFKPVVENHNQESIDDIFFHTGVSEENENEVASSAWPTRDDIDIVDSEKIPYFGMNFTSLENAKQFYIDYGKALGFSVVTRSTQKRIPHSDEVTTCQMTCERFGTYIERVKKKEQMRGPRKK
ncbi:hypothetical protein IFM89_030119 [Coptis chinensis]|uniref:FAR1 domain-containing protein n=1 Tax=Coptis chinensis TaxID=261450 RepID=A0A835I2B8_9MAGN|nr:hypothetical protein IFM89_030119 [Coptis chinensis]